MKRYLILLIVVVSFFSCSEKKEPEVINTTEKDSYMAWENLSPQLKGGFKYESPEWKKVDKLLQEERIREPEKFQNPGFIFRSEIYFDKNGSPEKIILLESINNEIDNAAIDFIQKRLKIVPPEKNNQHVKVHTAFNINYNPEGLSFFDRMDNSLLPETAPKDTYLSTVDEMPAPVDGIACIAKRIKYPEKAKEQGIEGKVIIKLLIDELGNPVSSQVIKGIDPLLDAEARNVLMKTKFYPGKNNGRPVKVQVLIPIVFKIK